MDGWSIATLEEGRWEWTDSRWGPHVGRPTYPLANSGSHWPSGTSLSRWEVGPGGITPLVGRPTFGAPGPPLASWWCPHLSCEVLSKIESSCTIACFHVGPRIHVLSVWTVESKHTWIQGLGLTPWSMPWLMPWRGAPGGPKPQSVDLGYGAHRAHFLLPCIEQSKSTSGTLLVINMFMWCLSSFNRGLLMGFWGYTTWSYFPSTAYLDVLLILSISTCMWIILQTIRTP